MTLLTKEHAALRAGCSLGTLDRALAADQIAAIRFGRRVLFEPAAVDSWIASRRLPIATMAEALARK